MATSAQEQMRQYWAKNQKLRRPNSPWLVYLWVLFNLCWSSFVLEWRILVASSWHLPMFSSLTHRVTGAVMASVLYIFSAGFLIAPDFETCLTKIKSWNIPKPILFICKTIAAFPLFYHSLKGMQHLVSASWLAISHEILERGHNIWIVVCCWFVADVGHWREGALPRLQPVSCCAVHVCHSYPLGYLRRVILLHLPSRSLETGFTQSNCQVNAR